MRRILLGTLSGLLLAAAGAFLIPLRGDLSLGELAFDRVELRLNDFTSSEQAHVALDLNADGQALVVWDSRRQQSGTSGVYARRVGPDGTILGSEFPVNVHRPSMQQMPAVAWNDAGLPIVAWTAFGQDGSGAGIIARSTGDEHLVPEATIGNQSQVALASLGDGRTVAVWNSAGPGGGQSICGRLLGPQGNPLGDEFRITNSDRVMDRLPTVAAAKGRFVVAWDRTAPDGEIEGIFARRFDAEFGPLADEFRVSTGDVDEIEPTIAMDGAGNFAIGWMRLDPGSDYDPFLRRFDRAGTPLSEPAPVSADRAGWQSGLALAMNSAGELAAAWTIYHEDSGTDAGTASDIAPGADRGRRTDTIAESGTGPAPGTEVNSADVMARLFAADGSPATGDFVVTEYSEGRQTLSGHAGSKRIALADDGTLAIAWQGDSGQGDPSAANLTLLRRPSTSLATRLHRDVKNQLAMRVRAEDVLFDASASPITPPVYDPSTIVDIVDPESYRSGPNGDLGFVGVTDTGWNPPDSHMAVGPNHLMLCTNGAVAARSKDGTLHWQAPIEGAGGFWGSLGAGSFVFDPEAHYDPYENRYYVMANERTGGRSYFLLGVSSSEDVTGSWHKYRFDVTAVSGDDIDSPNLGFDESAIYLTADFFGPDKFLIFIIDKASVIDGGAAITNSYLRLGTQSMGTPAQYTDEAPRMYLLEHFGGGPQTALRLWSINDPFGVPSISSINVAVDPYVSPGFSRSRGTSQQIFLFESRFWSCLYRDGSLWACHHIRTSTGSTTKARWYEIQMNGWPDSFSLPLVVQQGTVDAGESVYLTFNSIGVDAAGNAYMVFARSGIDEYYSISRTYHRSSDGPGVMSDPGVIKQSTATYSSDRWGDYSSVNADPVVPGKFWSHHEYTPGGNQWATWVQSETLPVIPTSVEEEGSSGLAALEAYPNPTGRRATLRFAVPRSGDVRVDLFNANGRQVRSLETTGTGAGLREVDWDGRTNAGELAPNGVYLARVSVDGVPVASGRLTLAR